MVLLTLWVGLAIITYAIRCPLPKPWETSATGHLNLVCSAILHKMSHTEIL